MARADLLLSLARAGKSGNQSLLRQTLEALIAEERAKKHTVLAEHLAKILNENGYHQASNGIQANRTARFLFESIPQKSLGDLFLTPTTREIISQVVEEHHRSDLLRTYGIEPRNKILLLGPPGNGKTSLAEALADALLVPLYSVKYHAVIASFLGETGARLNQVFEEVRSRKCVLFFDEFDAIAKERGDTHETGEIKRVVSSLLLEIDALPSYVVTVTATNHPELLDRAVWRRFQIRIVLPKPGLRDIDDWLEKFRKRLTERLSVPNSKIAGKLLGLSYAELEQFGNDVLRRRVLEQPNSGLESIVTDCLKQWTMRSKASI